MPTSAVIVPPDTQEKLATFGGGCFWCTEAIFQSLKGVLEVESGYSGGATQNPSYDEVCSGETGHAEVVQVTYDPEMISFEDLIRVHLSTHDPTTFDSQGDDVGSQYRSIIFFRDEQERRSAEDLLGEYAEIVEEDPVTELHSFVEFFPAEDDHRNYYAENPDSGYCISVIKPKVDEFRETFRHLLA